MNRPKSSSRTGSARPETGSRSMISLKKPLISIRSARSLSAVFADFSVTKTDDLDFGPEPDPVYPRGMIREWEVSQTFPATNVEEEKYPAGDLLQSLEWQKVVLQPQGLLDMARHRPRRLKG